MKPTDITNRNIVLLGMPGAGKSTIGLLLAETLGRPFVDADEVIESREGRKLQEIIDRDGLTRFREVEEECVLSLVVAGYVIAPGGSVIYSDRAMARLKENGLIVLLDLSLETVVERIHNPESRGIVREPGQSLRDLYFEREPLYRRYADLVIDCEGKTDQQVVSEILSELGS